MKSQNKDAARIRNGMRAPATASIEALESRRLLASAAAATIAGLDLSNPKAGPLAKLGPLVPIMAEYQSYVAAHGGSGDGFVPRDRSYLFAGDGIAIEAYNTRAYSADKLAEKLAGHHLRSAHKFAKSVSGILPFADMAALASIATPELSLLRPIRAITHVGSVTAQSDPAIRGDIARTTYGLTGSGVKVGVLSDSFDFGPGSYSSDVSSGDLPAGIQVIQDYSAADASDEGRAMTQLVYDTAPGTTLAFATAFVGGQTGFANNIKALRNAGSKVIIDDVAYFAEPFFQDGEISQAVDDVTSTGSVYFSAAGNQASQAYESAFRSGISRAAGSISGSPFLTFSGGLTHDFDPGAGVDDMQAFSIPAGGTLVFSFQWDQPYGTIPSSNQSCANDMDIYILNSGGTSLLAAANTNNIGNDPIELIDYTNTGGSTQTVQVMIVRRSGTSPGMMKYVDFYGDGAPTEFATNSGTIVGHSNSATGAAVGAAGWYNTPAFGVNPPVVQSYSSRGGTDILFDNAGNRLGSALVRNSPHFTAPDGANTTFFYQDSGVDADTFPNFFGTSAAAPTAGAVAALLLQASPSLTPSQIFTVLQNTALDMDDPATGGFDVGFDEATGFGLIRADAAIAAVFSPTGSISGTVYEDRNASGTFDAGDVTLNGITVNISGASSDSTVTSGSGNFSFPTVPNGAYTITQALVAGTYVVTSAASLNVNVTGNSVTGQNFFDFPITYGTSADDNFLVRTNVPQLVTGYSDNFNRVNLDGDYDYTTAASAGDGGASIVSNRLVLTNDATAAAEVNGTVSTSTPISEFGGLNPVLTNNTSVVTWTFNMRQSRANPGGLTAGAYGAGVVLASTTSTFNTGNGYAVVVGQSGSNDPLRLVRYTGGLGSVTSIITGGTDATSNYWSVRVTYNPANDQWSMFTRNDGASAFADPATGTLTQQGSATANTTHTSATMTHFGTYWSYSTTAGETATFDNFAVDAGLVPSPLKVEVLVNNVPTYSAPKSMLPSLAFNLGNGNDILTVDFVNDSPVPTGGLSYDGGSQSVGDQLLIAGTSAAEALTATSSAASLDGQSISYANAESLVLSGLGGADTYTVNSTAAGTPVTIEAADVTTTTVNETTAGAPVLFKAGAGFDTLSVNPDNTGSAEVLFPLSQTLASLSIGTGGKATLPADSVKALTVTGALSVAAGQLDLTTNALILQSTALATVRALIASGRGGTDFANGNWQGVGINSSTAAAGDLVSFAIGYVENSTLPTLGLASYTTFFGQTVDSSSLLIRYTLGADANLDGKVNTDDVTVVGALYNNGGSGEWFLGDYDYDGICDTDDVTVLGAMYDPTAPALAPLWS